MTDKDKIMTRFSELVDLLRKDYVNAPSGEDADYFDRYLIASDAMDLMIRQEVELTQKPPKEAEWIEVDEKHDAFDCSRCGAMVERKCLYCPGCGARMKNGSRVKWRLVPE